MAVTSATLSGSQRWLEHRYKLPKVALVIISLASLVGVFLTMHTHGGNPLWAGLRWVHLAGLGALAGGLLWQGFFSQGSAAAQGAAEVERFLVAGRRRFARLAQGVLLAVVLSLPVLGWLGLRTLEDGAAGLWGLNVIVMAAALLAVVRHNRSVATGRSISFTRRTARVACVLLIATLALSGWLDAELTFNGWWVAVLLRTLHVTAFGLWFGGAIWNIFISVPAARDTLAYPVVVAAAEQLEDFRKTVRVFLPVLFLTGLVQALPYTGWTLDGWIAGPIGRLVLLKLAFVVSLVGIFITCPLWRACSPIRGMCDLEDLAEPAAAEPVAARRLDNRGRACAGFVHIRKALDEMSVGAVLELLSTDAISWWELPAWLEKHGQRLLVRERKGRWPRRYYRFLVEKTAATERPPSTGTVPVTERATVGGS